MLQQGVTKGQKDLKCSRCQKVCLNMSSLLQHIRDRHKPGEDGGGSRDSAEKTPTRDSSAENKRRNPQSDEPSFPSVKVFIFFHPLCLQLFYGPFHSATGIGSAATKSDFDGVYYNIINQSTFFATFGPLRRHTASSGGH